jgi:xanthine dehydrogenase accessory factor
MIVTGKDVSGSIGGGQLEYRCTQIAVDMLRGGQSACQRQRFPLGSNLGQCCGGVVDVLFERSVRLTSGLLNEISTLYANRTPFVVATSTSRKLIVTPTSVFPPDQCEDPVIAEARRLLVSKEPACSVTIGDETLLLEPVSNSDFNVAVFGAGHVGSALIRTLTGLDCSVRWIDSRRNVFPVSTADNIQVIESDDPASEIGAIPDDAYYLVMTHSHPLDYEICARILQGGRFAYLGLIGSMSKRRRFERLMRQQGMSQSLLERLTCPIGIDGISGKKPQEISIAAVAEIMWLRDTGRALAMSANDNVHVI